MLQNLAVLIVDDMSTDVFVSQRSWRNQFKFNVCSWPPLLVEVFMVTTFSSFRFHLIMQKQIVLRGICEIKGTLCSYLVKHSQEFAFVSFCIFSSLLTISQIHTKLPIWSHFPPQLHSFSIWLLGMRICGKVTWIGWYWQDSSEQLFTKIICWKVDCLE